MSRRKVLFTGAAPTMGHRDATTALSFLVPWRWNRWKNGDAAQRGEQWIKKYTGMPYAITYDSGRSALFFALKSLRVGEGDDVLVQAYTCVVVANAIRHVGARPVYVDITENFTMDPKDAEKKISHRTKAMIIQHTFGHSAAIHDLIALAKKHEIVVIEDCAHALGVRKDGKMLGSWGDIGMFSFGADKSISSVRGGALVTRDQNLANQLKCIQQHLPHFSSARILQHLLFAPLMVIGKALYRFGIGKWFIFVAKKYAIIAPLIQREEKQGKWADWSPGKYSNALASLLLGQIPFLDARNDHRRKIASLYRELLASLPIQHPPDEPEACYLRYTIRVKNPVKLRQFAVMYGVYLGDWYDTVIAPKESGLVASGYSLGSCSMAEQIAKESVNLPTDYHIEEKDARFVCDVITKFYGG